MLARVLALLVVLSTVVYLAIAWFAAHGRIELPADWNSRWNPFTPFDVQAPHGPLSAWKFWRATHDDGRCAHALATSNIAYRPVRANEASPRCPLENAVRIEQLGSISVSSSFIASCPLALGLAVYVHDPLQNAAQRVYGQNVRRIDHVGSYACRNVNHAASGPPSEHASADALDIEAFVLEDGTRISVQRNWSAGTRASQFLRAARDRACDTFHVVLGPDFNALHSAHFHFDMGRFRLCR
ncbi:extensin family protein [Paraburkholderia sp. SARCC-3016]|jgi:hypothetical protein|uniref:extensin-like domain-containing protein n=1 Tax=Paraburkholderia sp. SARCC-3016 TaxID=3058611 RepID=UPI002809DF4E|nr:extensin family protein [Paraburkholderia sp. SARCC-3016]MDQ7976015.1 extensin family protein [Paraburkholderia sp. SARCC-3016]